MIEVGKSYTWIKERLHPWFVLKIKDDKALCENPHSHQKWIPLKELE